MDTWSRRRRRGLPACRLRTISWWRRTTISTSLLRSLGEPATSRTIRHSSYTRATSTDRPPTRRTPDGTNPPINGKRSMVYVPFRIVLTRFRAPRADAFAERWVHTVRTECLDGTLVLRQRHLERVLREYVADYNARRRTAASTSERRTRRRVLQLRSPICGYPTTRRPRRAHTRAQPGRMTQIRGLCPSCSPGRCPGCGLEAGGGHPLSCVFVPSTSITCRSVLSSPARISIRRGLASGATGIWIVSTPCS